MSKYYDGTKLLSLKDINGNKPEIYRLTLTWDVLKWADNTKY